jgi:uncharacterized membrane protein YfcA
LFTPTLQTSIASFTSHRKTDAVNFDLLRLWSVPIIAGVIGGTVPARYAPAAVFKTVFVLVALLTAVRLIFRDRLPTLGQEVPRRLRVPYGLAIGLSASLIGIGGGILSNMIMTFHGRAIHESIATSAGVGVMVSIPGALGYVVAGWDRMGLPPFSAGFVSIAAVLALRPTGFLAAKLGARVAHHLSRRRLELCFATNSHVPILLRFPLHCRCCKRGFVHIQRLTSEMLAFEFDKIERVHEYDRIEPFRSHRTQLPPHR